MIAEVDRARDRGLAARARVRAPPEHAGDHARGDHARRLRGRATPARREDAARRAWSRCSPSPPRRRRSGFDGPGIRRLPHYRRLRSHASRAPTSCSTRRSPSAAPTPTSPSARTSSRCCVAARVRRRLADERPRAARPADDPAARRPRDDRDRRSPGPSTCSCTRPEALERLRAELAAGDDDYLDAVVDESLRVRPVVPITGRLLREHAELGGYELDAGHGRPRRRSTCAHTNADIYPGPVRVPARALPRRRAAGDLLLDPVRRRHPPLHRRRLRRSSRCGSRCETILALGPTCAPADAAAGDARSAATSPSRRPTAPG